MAFTKEELFLDEDSSFQPPRATPPAPNNNIDLWTTFISTAFELSSNIIF